MRPPPDRRKRVVFLFRQRRPDQVRADQPLHLVDTQQAERMQLFGPGTLSPKVRDRFGDFVAFPFRAATLAYHPPNKPVGELFLAVHAGLSPQEMRVPLCVW